MAATALETAEKIVVLSLVVARAATLALAEEKVLTVRLVTVAMLGDDASRLTLMERVIVASDPAAAVLTVEADLIIEAEEALATLSNFAGALVSCAALGDDADLDKFVALRASAALADDALRMMKVRLTICAMFGELAVSERNLALIAASVADEGPAVVNVRAACLTTAAALGEVDERMMETDRVRAAELVALAVKDLTRLTCAVRIPTALLAAEKTRRATRVATNEATLGLAPVRVMRADRVSAATEGPIAVLVALMALVIEAIFGDAAVNDVNRALAVCSDARLTDAAASVLVARLVTSPADDPAALRSALVDRMSRARLGEAAERVTLTARRSAAALEPVAVKVTILSLTSWTIPMLELSVTRILRACLVATPTLGEAADRIALTAFTTRATLEDVALRMALAERASTAKFGLEADFSNDGCLFNKPLDPEAAARIERGCLTRTARLGEAATRMEAV